jgi:hypothetical protein
MSEERQLINIDGKVYDADDLSQDVKNNLVALQTGGQGIQILQSLLRLAQAGSEEILRTTKKQLPAPMQEETATPEGISDDVTVSDAAEITNH